MGKAGNSYPMQAVQFKEDYLTYFRDNFVVPHEEAALPGKIRNLENYYHTTTTITDKDYKKRYRLPAAIAGDMKPDSGHSDANTLGRDLLPLDFDDIKDEGDFLYQIYYSLARVGIGFIIYKTFSYRPDNVRYRVLIPLSRMVTDKNEFKALMMALAATFHIKLDPAATRWGQVFILPVMTEDNTINFMTVHEGYPLVVDSILERILKNEQLAPVKQALLAQPTAEYQAPMLKTALASEWDDIVDGTLVGGYTETHFFMTRIGMSNGEIEAWLKYFDTLVPHPQTRKKQVGGDDYGKNVNGPDKNCT
ncbi:replication protein, phage-plasmid associated, partial [Lacticaseibacillus paracasei subsp. paracasei Lpp126]